MDDVQVHPHSGSRPGEGYLVALGYLQMGTGAVSIMISLMAFMALLSHPELLDPAKVFGLSSGWFHQGFVTYVSLQLGFGWIPGALQIAAGVCCLNGRSPRFVSLASILSLGNFPHGTAAAILTLHGLRHAGDGERGASGVTDV